MQGTVTVYFNTGFNGVDIPAEPSVLELASKKVYPDYYYIREDLDKPFIKIKDDYESLSNVDYCKIETTSGRVSYFFAIPSAISSGVTMLTLELDALLTMGGAKNLNYTSGWQERGHISKSEDKLFANIASEAWTPSNPLVSTNLKLVDSTKSEPGADVTGDLTLIATNVNLSKLGDLPGVQDCIEGQFNGTAKMYMPGIPTHTPSQSTILGIYDDLLYVTPPATSGHSYYKTPGTALYDMTNTHVQDAVEKLYSAGQLQLQSSYIIPDEYYTAADMPDDPEHPGQPGKYTRINDDGHVFRITGIEQETTEVTLPFVYDGDDQYVVKNKKCLETYRSFVIVNLGSGDMCSKSPHELYDGESTCPKVKIWADPSATGKPYARFSYIKDNPLLWSDCVKGLQWANAQLSLEGASGSLWNSISNAFNKQALARDLEQTKLEGQYSIKNLSHAQRAISDEWVGQLNANAFNKMGGFAQMIAGTALTLADPATAVPLIGKGASQLFSAHISQEAAEKVVNDSLAQYDDEIQRTYKTNKLEQAKINQAINENSVDLYKNNQLVAPTLLFSPEQNLGLYGYNRFVIYEIRKSDADLKSEDMYYQRFGYSGLHRPLTASCFNARQYYSYVQAFNINIKGDFGLRIRQKAISQLNSGVRVWKVLPDASYYETN